MCASVYTPKGVCIKACLCIIIFFRNTNIFSIYHSLLNIVFIFKFSSAIYEKKYSYVKHEVSKTVLKQLHSDKRETL